MVPKSAASAAGAAERFSVRCLTLSAFRCYRTLRLTPDPRPVVLVGPNGAGKTNLLEALSYLSPGRGLRGAKLAAVAHRAGRGGEPGDSTGQWAVAADLMGPKGPVSLGSGWSNPGPNGAGRERRAVKIDGAAAHAQAALAQHVSMVWLTPEMDRLFSDAPAARRRFLDRLVYGLDPDHAARVQNYDSSRRERTRLLRAGGGDPPWLSALERNMAGHAVAIAAARLDFVARLADALRDAGEPFPRPEIAVTGLIEDWLATMPALDAEERYQARLAADRRRDAEAGTSEGVHRSDLVVRLDAGGEAAAVGSTGEQKATLIALVLAHARLLAGLRGGVPILLLDEVVAHLDAARRAALFEEILALGAQAWMSGTDHTLFAPLGDGAQFHFVRNAIITKEARFG
jgi:DNA replication and repair protein RecF